MPSREFEWLLLPNEALGDLERELLDAPGCLVDRASGMGASTKPGEFMMSTSSIDALLDTTLVRALVSWMPPSQKLAGSKMMESPRGLPDASVAVMALLEDWGNASSTPIPKEKSSKDIPLSLAAPPELEGSSSRVFFLDDDNGRRPSLGPRPKSIPAAVIR